ncbi:RecQ family ATP-dependent DNA helicase [Oscillatoria sp. CS-180]|uniref:RecQ family ATP-dependent DNA helicase n=1 Tax=Oscillatoria sp. CS-180 TaxID=3021720 RepID=UPI00232B3DD4|nr:RecQ family ATP-dependent DNA helicase [Oscillatoria sp. CS-180]MDB9526065.1 RecQ family ATP-dependent DNA helicase [Oscillatoria sp. CS-180]
MTASSPPNMAIAQARLQKIWGYSHFRPPQDTVIHSLLQRQDALIILPTGGGKSLCFQLPALLQTGLTLVVSPLVALMENQVQDLRDRRLPAATLHSERPKRERWRVLKALKHQQLRLLYLSPETLLSESIWQELICPDLKLNGLVLDEAHCLVQWGETFRPAYRRLGIARQALQQGRATAIPIAAFTATADPIAQQIIRQTLRLRSPTVVRLSPYRANLHLSVQTVWTPRGRQERLLKFVRQHPHQTGLIYVRTRRDSEGLADWLRQQGYRATNYHAGLTACDRRQREQDWIQNRVQIVVATNAFGMGVNKPDLRWVVHYHVPSLLTEYVQEIGRAGRDGKPAQAMALVSERTGWFDPTDKQRSLFFQTQAQKIQQKAIQISRQIPPYGSLDQVEQQFKDGAIALSYLHSQERLEWTDPFHYRLRSHTSIRKPHAGQSDSTMPAFLQSANCRWQTIVQQFGFRQAAQQLGQCGHCDNCR